MTHLLKRFRTNEKGAAAIEVALTLPILITIMIGILQFALILQAQGAMRHGIGEGLRMAKVDASATKSQILSETKASLSGINISKVTSMDFTRGTKSLDGEVANWGRITINYEMQPIIPFAPVPPIKLTATRTVYLPS